MEKNELNHIQFPFAGYEGYYNFTDIGHYAITMDVDWASDEVLAEVLNWFKENDLPITVFMTHQSDVLLDFAKNSKIEVAIHPNFSKSTDALASVSKIFAHYPTAVGSRSHRNIIGRDFTDALATAGLKYDASKLLWMAKGIEVLPLYNGMVEIPYIWEDGVHLELCQTDNPTKMDFFGHGLKILNIHPVLFFLNHRNVKALKAFTSKYTDLTKAPFDDFKAAKNNGFGIGDFSKAMFLNLKSRKSKFFLLSELFSKVEDYKKSNLNTNNNWQ